MIYAAYTFLRNLTDMRALSNIIAANVLNISLKIYHSFIYGGNPHTQPNIRYIDNVSGTHVTVVERIVLI